MANVVFKQDTQARVYKVDAGQLGGVRIVMETCRVFHSLVVSTECHM